MKTTTESRSAADPYQLLGIPRAASAQDVRRAHRRMAKLLHPDVRRHDPEAEARFMAVQRAYEILRDSELRRAVDAELDARERAAAARAERDAAANARAATATGPPTRTDEPSLPPEGRPSAARTAEQAAADWLAAELEQLGAAPPPRSSAGTTAVRWPKLRRVARAWTSMSAGRRRRLERAIAGAATAGALGALLLRYGWFATTQLVAAACLVLLVLFPVFAFAANVLVAMTRAGNTMLRHRRTGCHGSSKTDAGT